MFQRFSIRQVESKRESFGNYEYDVLDGNEIIARYWHDYRGDEHGVIFSDGNAEDWPVGRMVDFINGGGTQPLTLSPAAIEWLKQRCPQ